MTAKKRGQVENLKPLEAGTERCRKVQRKGTEAAAKARARKRARRELAAAMLDNPASKKAAEELAREFPELEAQDLTRAALIIAAVIKKAEEGDVPAFREVMGFADQAGTTGTTSADKLSEALRNLADEL